MCVNADAYWIAFRASGDPLFYLMYRTLSASPPKREA